MRSLRVRWNGIRARSLSGEISAAAARGIKQEIMSDTNDLVFSITDGGTSAAHPPIPPLSVLAGPATSAESNLIRSGIFPIACWRIGDIRFHFDSSFVVPEARTEFQTLSRMIKDRTEKSGKLRPPPLSVFGHADPTGDDEYNKALSGRRAAAIYA